MKCFFKHDWVYMELKTGEDRRGQIWEYYNKRKCNKCGKLQQNLPSIDRSMGECLINKWATIGYGSHNTGSGKQ